MSRALTISKTSRGLSFIAFCLSAICATFTPAIPIAQGQIAENPRPPSTSPNGRNNARLYNFDNESRVRGMYIVGFKSEAALKDVMLGTSGLKVLPHVMPTSESNIKTLAAALAKQVDGVVRHVYSKGRLRGFALTAASEERVKALAQDPRIEYIEAEIRFSVN